MTTLDHLPYELLEKILLDANVPSRILFELSLLSSRLQSVCLDMYIRLTAGRNLQKRCVARLSCDGPQQDVVSALLAVDRSYLPTMQYFECHFQRGETTFLEMQQDFQRVEKLVTRLEFIGKVVLHFHGYLGETDKGNLAGWCQAFGRLLDCIIHRGCTALEVNQGERQLVPLHCLDPPSVLSKIKLSMARMIGSREPSKFRTNRNHISLTSSHEVQGRSRLASLSIGSELMLSHPFLQWTCSALRTSPITMLSLQDLNAQAIDWVTVAQVLPSAAPHINTIKISKLQGLRRKDLAALINGFSTLESISISTPTFNPEIIYREGQPPTPENVLYDSLKDVHCYPRWGQLRELTLSKKWIQPALLTPALKDMGSLEKLVIVFYGLNELFALFRLWAPTDPEVANIQSLLEMVASSNLTPGFDIYFEMPSYQWVGAWNHVGSITRDPALAWPHLITGIVFSVHPVEWHFMCKRAQEFSPDLGENVQKFFTSILPGVRRVMMRMDCEAEEELVEEARDFCTSAMMRGAFSNMDCVEVAGTILSFD